MAKSLPIQKAKGNSHLMGNLGKKPKKSHHFPMSVIEFYSSLLKEGLITLVIPKSITNLSEGYDISKTCKFHYDAPRHSIEECRLLRHKIQSLIDSDALIFEGATQSKVATTTTFDAQGEEMNAIIRERDDFPDLEDLRRYLDDLFVGLVDLKYIRLKELKEQGNTDETCKYQSGAWVHSLGDCDEFNKEVKSLINRGIIRWGKLEKVKCCMASNGQLTLIGLNARFDYLEN